ncbi:MAG: 4Fe-4S binding protein, partial [Synergistaceae bacterium]|jgi:indolepyruvate ferredoxin oxidoreductase alpha subunit|nr:4Fe-4S binding protein [Synergistaceae bacterium]
MAQGLHRVEPDTVNFAFIGDSTFFHTGIPGVLNAVYNKADIIVSVLDNSTTAMTGGQPHPGTGRTAMGGVTRKADICGVLSALGVDDIQRVNAFDLSASASAVERAMSLPGVKAIIFEGECVSLIRGKNGISAINEAKCAGCAVCVKNLGCPALTMEGKKASIDGSACTGCGVCAQLCKFGAIEEGALKLRTV